MSSDGIKCPHCNTTELTFCDANKISWTIDDDDTLKELWLCDACAGYFMIYYKRIKTVPIIEKEF